MPNRILREGILTSPRIAKLTWASEAFYRRLHSVVDDFGRFHAHPMLLRAACYPLQLDKVSDSDIGKWLGETQKAALVRVYEVAEQRYLELLDFRQQVRATKSKFPNPLADAAQVCSECVADAEQVRTKTYSNSKSKSETNTGAFAPPEWIPDEAWQGFEAMRAKIRKPMTDRARGLIVAELEKLKAAGDDPVAVLAQSERNSWQDVFPVRDKSAAKPGSGATAQWWASEAGIIAKGRELSLQPRPGESMPDFKGRINVALESA